MNAQTSAEYVIALDGASERSGRGKIVPFPSANTRFKGHLYERGQFLEVARETSAWESLLYATMGLSALGGIAAALGRIVSS